MSKATEYTLKQLRDVGYVCDMAERLLPQRMGMCPRKYKDGRPRPCIRPGKRHDLFGFCDIVAMRADVGIVAVQSTTATHHAQHKADILANSDARLWVQCGGRLLLMSWSKQSRRKSNGKPTKAKYWTPRDEEITEEMFERYSVSEKGGDKGAESKGSSKKQV